MLLILLLLIFGVSSFFVIREIGGRKHTRDLYEDLASRVSSEEMSTSDPAVMPSEPEKSALETGKENPIETEPPVTEILSGYEALYEQNPDMIGF